MGMLSPKLPCCRAPRQKRLRKSWSELSRWPPRLVRMRAPVDQNGPEIVDVGKGRAGDQQVAEPGAIRTASSSRPPGAVIAPSSTRLTTSSRYGTRSRTIVPEYPARADHEEQG